MSSMAYLSFSASMNALGIVEISTGYLHNCALFSSGRIICWGSNENGELGAEVGTGFELGDNSGELAALIPVNFMTSIVTFPAIEVAAGRYVTCGTLILNI